MSGSVLDALLVLAFVLLGGAFAAAEIALVSLRDSQVKALSEQGRRGRRLAELVADPNRFLAAVQVGVTLAGFFSAAFGAATLARPLADWLVRSAGWGRGTADAVAFVAVTVAVSFVSLVLGELAPKRIGLQRAERIALFAARPLNRIASAVRPLIWLLSRTTDLVVRLVGGDPGLRRESITEEELRGLVAAHESLSGDERKMIDEVFAAGERQVREVMLPRTEVEFLDGSMTVSRAAKIAMDSPHSRYPVMARDADDVVGFVHIRDLLADPPGGRAATVAQIARPVKRVPGSKQLLPTLSEMRREGHHLAIVVDEYGGTDGIVTLEDLIEEVIGDIRDEYDPGDDAGPPRPDGVVEVDGLLNLDDFADRTGLRLPDGPYETVGGYLMAALGRLPVAGDEVGVDGWRLNVAALDGRRVAKVRVVPPGPPADPGTVVAAAPGVGG